MTYISFYTNPHHQRQAQQDQGKQQGLRLQ